MIKGAQQNGVVSIVKLALPFLMMIVFIGWAILSQHSSVIADTGFVFEQGDIQASFERGRGIYSRCVACHAFEYNRVGPKHCGLADRRAGSLPDYQYSNAMQRSGISWDFESLDEFLASPRTVVPGTTMGYAGIANDEERSDLIVYILTESVSERRCGNE